MSNLLPTYRLVRVRDDGANHVTNHLTLGLAEAAWAGALNGADTDYCRLERVNLLGLAETLETLRQHYKART